MDPIQKLAEKFADFPGIGPRQAKRFVYYLLSRSDGYIDDFIRLLGDMKSAASRCPSCQRFFMRPAPSTHARCPTCNDNTRDNTILMIVEREADFENVEKSHAYHGGYFILGGTLPILEKNPERRIRARELLSRIRTASGKTPLKEVIFALSATTEGDHTRHYLETFLRSAVDESVRFSSLGRGLSTGLELEYSDMDTLKNALDNRK